MKKSKLFIVLSVIVVGILFITNPSQAVFKNYLLMNEFTPKEWNDDIIKSTENAVNNFTIRQNYIIFSVYDFKFAQEQRTSHKKYFAIFNQIIRIRNESTGTVSK